MALNIKIDFQDIYPVRFIDALNYSVFDTELKDGTSVSLGIKISSQEHPLMAGVYNLAFGPVNRFNLIDDQIKLTHKDHSKVFSTIVFEGGTFENEDFLTVPKPIEKGESLKVTRLYNYFIFRIKG